MCLCSHRVVVKQQYGSIEDSAMIDLRAWTEIKGGALTLLRCEDGSVCPASDETAISGLSELSDLFHPLSINCHTYMSLTVFRAWVKGIT